MLTEYDDSYFVADPANKRAVTLLRDASIGKITTRNKLYVTGFATVVSIVTAVSYTIAGADNTATWSMLAGILGSLVLVLLCLWIGLRGLDWVQRMQLHRLHNNGTIQKIDADFKVWFDDLLTKRKVKRFAYEQYELTGPDFVALMSANLAFSEALAEDVEYQNRQLVPIVERVLDRIDRALFSRWAEQSAI